MVGQTSSDTVATLIALAVAAERAAQEMYRILVERFADRPLVADVWRQMMHDEATHIGQLEAIRRTLTPEQLQSPVDPDVMWKARAINPHMIPARLNAVETVWDAYQLAHDLEHSEVNTVFEFIMLEFIPGGAQREFVAAQLQAHTARLEQLSALIQ
jgi:hypothetical protein